MDSNNPNNNQSNANVNNNNGNDNNNIYQIILNKLNQNNHNNNNNVFIKKENQENNDEEEYEEEEDSKKEKVEEKNFSQQVDFLYHPNDPEDQSSIKNILIKQYKKQKKIIPEKEKSKKSKTNIKKSKTSNKINKNKTKNKDLIPFMNKNKGLFDPFLTQKELDYESKIKKQREERQRKIDEYERNKNKKILEENINKRIFNYAKPKIKPLINAKNFAKKKTKKDDEDLIKHFVKIPKPKVQKKMAENLGFNPKKYDMIINSLLKEINEVKNQRKKENEMFQKQIQLYANDNVDKYNNYYEFIYKKQKLNYENNKIKNKKNNINKKPTRGQIINGLMKKYFNKDISKSNNKNDNINIDINEIINNNDDDNDNNNTYNDNDNINNNKKNKSKIMKNNYINDIIINNNNNNNNNNDNEINFDNIDKLLSEENLSFQDKIKILSEINKNIDNYYKEMPTLVKQVKTSLDKLYENEIDENNFRKEANKIPFVAMASKAAYQIIQSNNDIIIEKIIDELCTDCAYDLSNINQQKKNLLEKQQLIQQFSLVKDNINFFTKQEEDIFEKSNTYLKQKEELINNFNKSIDDKKNKIEIIKFRALLDDKFISDRDKYKSDFKNYMTSKGSFYHEKIFDIYEEFIEEEGENIMNKIIDNYIDKLHIYTTQMTNNEINNIAAAGLFQPVF